MVLRIKLENYLDEFLKKKSFNDYCPNGLQVEGKSKINNIITGVSANLVLLKEAIKEKSDAIIVHHGYFWKGEAYEITGIKYQRIAALIKHNIKNLDDLAIIPTHKLAEIDKIGLTIASNIKAELKKIRY